MSSTSCEVTKIEILLPLSQHETRPADLQFIAEVMLPSLERFCDPSFVERLVIIAPKGTHSLMEQLIANCRFVTVIGDQDELPSTANTDACRHRNNPAGFIEMAFSTVCRTDFYLLMTHRSFVVNFINSNLVIGGRMPRGSEEWERSETTCRSADLHCPIFLNRKAASFLLDWAISNDTDDWRAAYWQIIDDLDKKEESHYYGRPVAIPLKGSAIPSDFDLRDHSRPELFRVIDPKAEDPAPLFKILHRRVADSDDREQVDVATKKGGYEFIPEKVAQAMLLDRVSVWQTSFGGVGSNYVAQLLGIPGDSAYRLLCHYPYPLALEKPGFKALYIFDDPVLSVLSQLGSSHHINIAKNANINYSIKWCYRFNLLHYAETNRDLFNLASHFRNWTRSDPFLLNINYPVVMARFSSIGKCILQIKKHLGCLKFAKQDFEIKPRNSYALLEDMRSEVQAIRELYKNLSKEIEEFPDLSIWDPVTRRVKALS